MELHHILIAPVVTEKSTKAQTQKKYTFIVHAHANKIEIAQAIHSAYGVDVKTVRVIPVRGKVRKAGQGREITKRPDRKKVIVTVGGKGVIDFNKIKATRN
ncbi:50S ribosomal protein L23 [Candidatus Peregrinibacteria bacterium]|nr:50S ribosomal protein L23 [Candidatus Peregrinibacteria bacterium]